MNRSAKSEGLFQPQTLDVDETIFDRNLKIVDGGDRASDSLLGLATKQPRPLLPDNCPVVKVTPTPGICIKTRNVENEKVFVNLCKIQEIPPPPPLSEEELKRIIASDDYSTSYRVPMSLGAPREEKDKSGQKCLACDVAINSVWFEDTMFDSLTFTTFVVNLAMEGLCDKYGDRANLDRQQWTVLRNKKYLGDLQRHHIQQRANSRGSEAKILEVTAEKKARIRPQLTLVKEPADSTDPELLTAWVELPEQASKNGLALDVGEDRLVLESERYLLDVFLPFSVKQNECSAQFNKDGRQLMVTMPLTTAGL